MIVCATIVVVARCSVQLFGVRSSSQAGCEVEVSGLKRDFETNLACTRALEHKASNRQALIDYLVQTNLSQFVFTIAAWVVTFSFGFVSLKVADLQHRCVIRLQAGGAAAKVPTD